MFALYTIKKRWQCWICVQLRAADHCAAAAAIKMISQQLLLYPPLLNSFQQMTSTSYHNSFYDRTEQLQSNVFYLFFVFLQLLNCWEGCLSAER